MGRLVLIDGTNFFFKGTWGQGALTCGGKNVKALYSFVNSIPTLMRRFDKDMETDYVVCWDGGHDERTRVSTEAVAKGIIPKAYKQERREARGQDDCDFAWQIGKAREFVSCTRVAQAFVPGEEADDLVASLCERSLGKYSDIVLVTTDKDYYQLLKDGVRMYNSSKDEFVDASFLKGKYGLDSPSQWVDVGAIAGETGASSDTIYGVRGMGYVTAAALVARHGSLDGVLAFAERRFSQYIEANGYEAFRERVLDGSYKPDCLKEAKVLASRDVVEVARELKRMRSWLDFPFPKAEPNWERLDEFAFSVKFNIRQENYSTLLRR